MDSKIIVLSLLICVTGLLIVSIAKKVIEAMQDPKLQDPCLPETDLPDCTLE